MGMIRACTKSWRAIQKFVPTLWHHITHSRWHLGIVSQTPKIKPNAEVLDVASRELRFTLPLREPAPPQQLVGVDDDWEEHARNRTLVHNYPWLDNSPEKQYSTAENWNSEIWAVPEASPKSTKLPRNSRSAIAAVQLTQRNALEHHIRGWKKALNFRPQLSISNRSLSTVGGLPIDVLEQLSQSRRPESLMLLEEIVLEDFSFFGQILSMWRRSNDREGPTCHTFLSRLLENWMREIHRIHNQSARTASDLQSLRLVFYIAKTTGSRLAQDFVEDQILNIDGEPEGIIDHGWLKCNSWAYHKVVKKLWHQILIIDKETLDVHEIAIFHEVRDLVGHRTQALYKKYNSQQSIISGSIPDDGVLVTLPKLPDFLYARRHISRLMPESQWMKFDPNTHLPSSSAGMDVVREGSRVKIYKYFQSFFDAYFNISRQDDRTQFMNKVQQHREDRVATPEFIKRALKIAIDFRRSSNRDFAPEHDNGNHLYFISTLVQCLAQMNKTNQEIQTLGLSNYLQRYPFNSDHADHKITLEGSKPEILSERLSGCIRGTSKQLAACLQRGEDHYYHSSILRDLVKYLEAEPLLPECCEPLMEELIEMVQGFLPKRISFIHVWDDNLGASLRVTYRPYPL